MIDGAYWNNITLAYSSTFKNTKNIFISIFNRDCQSLNTILAQ